MSDYFTGLSNQYTSSDYSNVNKLKDTINSTDYSKATDEELMEACKSFEAYFIEQAFKGMARRGSFCVAGSPSMAMTQTERR